MCDSACRWFIIKKTKLFWSYVKHFLILAGVRKCRILVDLCKDVLIDRIEHEYLFYCSNLVVNSCFLIFNPHKYDL